MIDEPAYIHGFDGNVEKLLGDNASVTLNLYRHTLFIPLYASRESFGPGNFKRSRALYLYTGPLDPRVA